MTENNLLSWFCVPLGTWLQFWVTSSILKLGQDQLVSDDDSDDDEYDDDALDAVTYMLMLLLPRGIINAVSMPNGRLSL